MASDIDPIDSLLPSDDFDLGSADSELALLEDSLDVDGTTSDDLVLGIEPPPPFGRSWQFDFAQGRYVGVGGRPLETRGLATLQGWIDKALHTERGSCAIHPPEYGLVGTQQGIGEGAESEAFADLEERVRDCLTFHPRISDIENFTSDYDPDEEYLDVRLDAVLDDGTRLPVEARLGA